jgi:uncharacterized protein YyaL (SSP411 family)
MEKESFEQQELADILNQHFVSIKVGEKRFALPECLPGYGRPLIRS